MTTEARMSGVRRRWPELILTLLVLAGLLNCLQRFRVDGKLPQPFIFDINDTFMDWFNTAYWAHHPGAFDNWKTVYPPLSFVFLKFAGISGCYASNSITARDCDYVGIGAIILSYFTGAVVAYLAFKKTDPATATFRGLSFGLGLPLLFTLERGNLILPCFVFFALAHGGLIQNAVGRAFAYAVTINFKPYLLLPVLALAFQRRWRLLELAGIMTILVYLLTFAILGEGSPWELVSNTLNWVSFTGGLVWEQIYYSTSFAPFMEFDSSRFPTRDFVPSAFFEWFVFVIPIVINATRLIALLSLLGAWLQPSAYPSARISTILLGASLVGQSPGGYTEVFLVFLLFLERWERPGPIVAVIAGYLLCIPYDYVLSNFVVLSGDSWLSGRTISSPFGISAGIFLRPALIVVIVWGLAIHGLSLFIRDHRTSPPTFGLRRWKWTPQAIAP